MLVLKDSQGRRRKENRKIHRGEEKKKERNKKKEGRSLKHRGKFKEKKRFGIYGWNIPAGTKNALCVGGWLSPEKFDLDELYERYVPRRLS